MAASNQDLPQKEIYASNQFESSSSELHSDDSELIDVADENEPVTMLGKHFWCAPLWKGSTMAFALFSGIPFLLCLLFAYFSDSLFLDDGTGFLEDYGTLSFFVLGILLPPLTLSMMKKLPLTIESLSDVVRFDSEETLMTTELLDSQINAYSILYCKATGRNLSGLNLEIDDKMKGLTKTLGIMKTITYVLCIGYFLSIQNKRFFGSNDVMMWHHWDVSPMGAIARTILDFLLVAVMGPIVIYSIVLCVMIIQHSLSILEKHNGIRFMRFSMDEAGGLGSFGMQSFANTIALLPYAVVLVGVIFQANSDGVELSKGLMSATVAYFGLLIFVFAFPLAGASRSMSKMKKMELKLLADYYIQAYEGFKSAMSSDRPIEEIKELSEAMIYAEEVFQGVLKQPAVPYSKALIAKLVSLVGPMAAGMGALVSFS